MTLPFWVAASKNTSQTRLSTHPHTYTCRTAFIISSQKLGPEMASTVITRPIRQIPTAAHPILQATKEINGQKNAIQPAETVQRQCLAQEPQAVKQQQSLALVQIMLHASVSYQVFVISYLRFAY